MVCVAQSGVRGQVDGSALRAEPCNNNGRGMDAEACGVAYQQGILRRCRPHTPLNARTEGNWHNRRLWQDLDKHYLNRILQEQWDVLMTPGEL